MKLGSFYAAGGAKEVMQFVKPKVFLIGESRIINEGLQAYLEHVGAPDWTSDMRNW